MTRRATISLDSALRFVVAAGLTAYILWRANPAQVLAAAGSARVSWILAAILLAFADRMLMAYRWMVLLRALTPGTRPPFGALLKIFFLSTFVGSFLPNIAGDLYRAYSLARLRVAGGESVASVVMDRALGVLSMIIVATAALAFSRDLLRIPGVIATLSIAAAVCAAGAAAIYSERVARMVAAAADHVPGARTRRLFMELLEAIRRYAHHHRDVTNVLASSIVVQALRVVQAYCLGEALGIRAPLWTYFVFVPLIVIIMQIPVTVMGLGTSQAAFALFFGRVGVPEAQAVALSILFLALGVLGNLPGGLLYLTGGLRAAPEEAARQARSNGSA
jgi:glycosyltransferase 2 family protein